MTQLTSKVEVKIQIKTRKASKDACMRVKSFTENIQVIDLVRVKRSRNILLCVTYKRSKLVECFEPFLLIKEFKLVLCSLICPVVKLMDFHPDAPWVYKGTVGMLLLIVSLL